MRLAAQYVSSLLLMIFSNVLLRVEVRVIGLYEVMSLGSLFVLGMTVMMAVLKCFGM